MSLKKKIVIAVISIAILLGLGSFVKFQSDATKGNKAIHVVVKHEDETVYDKVLRSESETLHAFLAEQTSLNVVMEEGAYGAYISAMLDYASDAIKGPWWVYESENNETCIAQGMCPAIDQVMIQDEDTFTFTLKSNIAY